MKRQDAHGLTPSMRTALHDLDPQHLTVLYPGPTTDRLAPRVTVAPLALLHKAGPAHVLRPT